MSRYKVVRTWFIEAESTANAVDITRRFNHDQVEVHRLISETTQRYIKTYDTEEGGSLLDDNIEPEDANSGC